MVGTGRRVLDVGCGEGALSAHIAARGNDVTAVEADRSLASAAGARGVRVLVRNVETDPIEDLGVFDVIVCADVLEHLRYPEAAIGKLIPLLEPDGRLVVSLPNVAYYAVRLGLLMGRFNYTEGGIMDRTHLRFYTCMAARASLEGWGLIVRQDAISVSFAVGVEPVARFANQLLERRWVGTALYRFCSGFPGFFGYQYICECRAR